jgi:hypothetical protein
MNKENSCSGNGTREKGSRKRIDEIGNAGVREERKRESPVLRGK